MNRRIESIELLNATHEFPCVFTFKIIGKSSAQFTESVLQVFCEFTTNHPHHTIRETPGGRHLSITAEPLIEEAEHVLEIYDRLKSLDDVVMLL